MKNFSKILSLICIMLICLSLFACKPADDPGNTGGTVPEGDYIYSGRSEIQIVYPKGSVMAKAFAEELYATLIGNTYCTIKVTDDTGAEALHEIVIGNTNRQVTADAYKRFERLSFDPEQETRYLAYSSGNSIAIIYDEDVFDINLAADECFEKFTDEYVLGNDTLVLKEGVVYTGITKPLEYQAEIDAEAKEEAWEALYRQLGADEQASDIVDALKDYYGTFASSRVISWFADLYDTETGAFYYSNSGRNTVGYGPDIESTEQALGFLNNTGVFDEIGGVENIPASMKTALGKWVKGLQDPNGYFYHPQWSKDLVDSKLSRRARDLDRAIYLLQIAGLNPTYDTPNGDTGDNLVFNEFGELVDLTEINSEVKLTSRLMDNSVAVAVSKILPVAEQLPSHLSSETAFRKYLSEQDIRNNSYTIGNTLAAQGAQIKNADKKLGGKLIPIIEKWLKDNQNPDNGTWDWTYKTPLEGNNGVLKIAALYQELELEFPNPNLAIENAVNIIYGDAETYAVTDIYNTWYAIDIIFNNLKKFSADTDSTISEIRDSLLEDAPELIEKTMDKLMVYRKDDGSFSYNNPYSAATSQGVPVAVPNTNEGDVNATTISINGTLSHMLSVLGIKGPKLYGKSEYCLFFSKVNNLGEIIKDPVKPAAPITFEEELGENDYGYIQLTQSSSGTFGVINDPANKDNKVYLFDTKKDGGDSIRINTAPTAMASKSFVFEADFMVNTDKAGSQTIAQIQMDSAYMLVFRIADGRVHIDDSSSTSYGTALTQNLGISRPLGEWFRLRVEYYLGDHDTVRAVIYIGDEKAVTPVVISDNYYDRSGEKLHGEGTPYSDYAWFRILGLSASEYSMMIDNVLLTESTDEYIKDSYDHSKLVFDSDPPVQDEIIYDFEDSKIPEDLVVTVGGDVISAADKNLNISAAAGSSFEFSIPENKRTPKANATIFESLINVISADAGAKTELALTDNEGNPIAKLYLSVIEEGTNKFVVLTDEDGSAFDTVKVPVGTEFKLGLDYYPKEKAVVIILNGTPVDITENLCENAENYTSSKLKVTNAGTNAIRFTLDNIRSESNEKSFDDATYPAGGRVDYDFENGVPTDVITSGNPTVDSENRLSLDKLNSSVTLPLNIRGFYTNVLTSEFYLELGDRAGEGITVSILSDDGQVMFEYVFKTKAGKLYVHESTKEAVYPSLAAVEADGSVKITIDYFADMGITNIYANESPLLVTNLTYTDGSGALTPASLKIAYTAGIQGAKLDNIAFEKFLKDYTEETPSVEEDEDKTLTFDATTIVTFPTRITTTLKSAGASVVIREYIMKTEASKVLMFTSGAGNADKIFVEALGDHSDSAVDAAVFKTDLKVESTEGFTYEIKLMNGIKQIAYQLVLTESAGNFCIYDISGDTEQNVPGRIIGAKYKTSIPVTDAISLKIEAYKGDRDTVVYKTYINESLVYESSNFYGKSISNILTDPVCDITSVCIAASAETAAVMYLDNVYMSWCDLIEDDSTPDVTEPDVEIPVVPDNDGTIDGEDHLDGGGWV